MWEEKSNFLGCTEQSSKQGISNLKSVSSNYSQKMGDRIMNNPSYYKNFFLTGIFTSRLNFKELK